MNEELFKGNLGWRKIPIGSALPYSGTSIRFKTGDWRTHRPVVNTDKCTGCLICWIYCPDVSITRKDKVVEIDYDFCKGCGICAEECKIGAIEMVEE